MWLNANMCPACVRLEAHPVLCTSHSRERNLISSAADESKTTNKVSENDIVRPFAGEKEADCQRIENSATIHNGRPFRALLILN